MNITEETHIIGYDHLADYLGVSIVTARVYVMRYDVQPCGVIKIKNRFNREIPKFYWLKSRWDAYRVTEREYKGYKYLKKHFTKTGEKPFCDARVIQYGSWDMTHDWSKVDCKMCIKMGNTLARIGVANECARLVSSRT